MTWQEGVGIALVCVGLLAGVYVAAQRPSFWLEFGGRLFKKLAPFIFAYITKRMPPAEEEAWRKCQLRGGKWNHRTRKCE
jgi:hypothetical protein